MTHQPAPVYNIMCIAFGIFCNLTQELWTWLLWNLARALSLSWTWYLNHWSEFIFSSHYKTLCGQFKIFNKYVNFAWRILSNIPRDFLWRVNYRRAVPVYATGTHWAARSWGTLSNNFFQHDGATAHTAQMTLNFLRGVTTFGSYTVVDIFSGM